MAITPSTGEPGGRSLVPPTLDFSQSALQDYADCPRRFQLRYLQQMAWPAIEAEPSAEVEARQREGQEFHRLVQRHLLGVDTRDLEQTIHSPHVARWWENFRRANLDLRGWGLHSEVGISCALGQHRLVAKYDLVAVRDGRAVIYDWKTWARRPTDAWLVSRWQTRVYMSALVKGAAALNEGLPLPPENLQMVYWFAEYPDDPAILSYDSLKCESDWVAILEFTRQILAQQSFPMTADRRNCRFCVFRSHCDRGGPASVWEEPGDEAFSDPGVIVQSEEAEPEGA